MLLVAWFDFLFASLANPSNTKATEAQPVPNFGHRPYATSTTGTEFLDYCGTVDIGYEKCSEQRPAG